MFNVPVQTPLFPPRTYPSLPSKFLALVNNLQYTCHPLNYLSHSPSTPTIHPSSSEISGLCNSWNHHNKSPIPIPNNIYSHQLTYLKSFPKYISLNTPTSSGKTLCYNLSTHYTTRNKKNVIIIVPTKALGNSILNRFQNFETSKISIYNGDIPHAERSKILKTHNVIITNPDTIHYSLLPLQSPWLQNLGLIIIDEIHVWDVIGFDILGLINRIKCLSDPVVNCFR